MASRRPPSTPGLIPYASIGYTPVLQPPGRIRASSDPRYTGFLSAIGVDRNLWESVVDSNISASFVENYSEIPDREISELGLRTATVQHLGHSIIIDYIEEAVSTPLDQFPVYVYSNQGIARRMSSGQTAPSPTPRSTSTGPNGPLPTPTGAPLVNGVAGGSAGAGTGGGGSSTTGGSAGSGTQQMSQQSLNQIVIDYLAKKGYTKTEAMLRAESANQEPTKMADPKAAVAGPPKYLESFSRLVAWADDALDIYKPEVQRLLWPLFVYSYINLVKLRHVMSAKALFSKYSSLFTKEHEYDLRRFEHIGAAEHLNEENLAKIYLDNRYRLSLSNAAFNYFMQFLESLPENGFKLFIEIIEKNMDLRQVDRAVDDRFSFAAVIHRGLSGQDMPAEDEGIPGHRPGNAISSTDPAVGNNLATLKLGKLPMEKDLEDDVRAEVMDLDLKVPPEVGQPSLLQTHERLNIKQEDEDEGPNRAEIPFPPSTARDVTMEVQKIRETRDRLKIDGRTGGIGPAMSVVMYTFHNTHDSICCLDFSGDQNYVAAGMSESYIKVWTLDGSAFGPSVNGQPVNSHRLIGHSAPVYSVQFGPAGGRYAPDAADARPKWLLSSSGDGTIRLWNLDLFRCIVVYKGHVGPVWDVQWGPHGHYFVSGGNDKLGRIWQTDKIRQVRLLAGHDNAVEKVCWHPNSSYVFTASCDKTVRMWSMNNGNAVRMFTGHTSPITALSCSRDGKTLASADDTGTIILWDLAPGVMRKRMRGHGKGGIWSLSWSVESTVLVSGGADNTVRVWDVTGPPKDPATTTTSTTGIGTSSTNATGVGSNTKPGEQGNALSTTNTGGKPDPSNPGNTTGTGPSATTGGPSTSAPLASNTVGGVSLAGSAGPAKKKGKDAVITADQISVFLTKNTPVYLVKLTNMNLVLAGGPFLPQFASK